MLIMFVLMLVTWEMFGISDAGLYDYVLVVKAKV